MTIIYINKGGKNEKENLRVAVKNNPKEKGITLVALVITIIVLLILAVVSMQLIINNGILSKAETGVQKYSEAESDEQEQLLKAEYEMAKYEGKFSGTYTEYVLDKKYPGVKIGDYVAYDSTKDKEGNTITGQKATYTSYTEGNASPDKNGGRSSGYTSDQGFSLSKYTGGWRVLGIENGQLQLISASGITSDTNTNGYLLGWEQGYINGEEELNAISSIYGQGKYATGARSINVEDINNISGYKPETAENGKPYGNGTIYEYGNKVTYSFNSNNKVTYKGKYETQAKETSITTFKYYDENSRSFVNLAANDSKELTSKEYSYYLTTLTNSDSGDLKGIKNTSKEWNLLFGDSSGLRCWLASRGCRVGAGFAYYGIYMVAQMGNTAYVCDNRFINSDSSETTDPVMSAFIRPIVSLESDVQIEKTDANDGSSLQKACIIK